MEQASKTRLLIVGDQLMVRDALAHRLASDPRLEVAAVASSAGEAVERAARSKPEIVLIDVEVSGMSCFDAVRRMREAKLKPKVVFLSNSFHDHFLVEALEVGAAGFVLKSDPVESLIEALAAVARGESWFSKQVEARLEVGRDGKRTARTTRHVLSPREMQVLRYLADGHAKKQVAAMMGISVKTVEGHAQHLMKKLDIHNRVDLARYAIREGLIVP